jgi:hypothetical protein
MSSFMYLLSRAGSATWVACMKHWSLLTLSGIAVGTLSLVFWMMPSQETYQRVSDGPATRKEVIAIAAALGLHSVAYPLTSSEKNCARFSVKPLSVEELEQLVLNHPNFERWRGRVTVMGAGSEVFETTFDPAHPERYALWGKWFVYGDPELIAKLLSYYSHQAH